MNIDFVRNVNSNFIFIFISKAENAIFEKIS